MKRLILLLLGFNLLNSAEVNAGDRSYETRVATVNMEVSPNDLINIRAKNTDLVVEAWDKNQVEIIATVRFDGKMTDKMVSFLDNFQEYVEENIDFSAGELKINTNLDEPNKIQIGSKHVGIVIGFSEDEFRLDYKIKAPAKNDFEIDNSYKDVALIGDFDHVKLTQYSGKLKTGYIHEAELNLKYGSSDFKGIGSAEMKLYEQELDVESIEDLEIETKYSEIEIGTLSYMETVSYETDFIIESAKDITGNFKYGEMEVKGKLEKATFEFYEMDIEASAADIVEFKASKYGKLNFGQVKELKFIQSYEDELTVNELGNFKSNESKYGEHTIQRLIGSYELSAYEDDVEIEEVMQSVNSIDIGGKYIKASLGISNQSFHINTNVKYGKVNYNERDLEIRKYIKDGDKLEMEALSKIKKEDPILIKVEGYEIDISIQ